MGDHQRHGTDTRHDTNAVSALRVSRLMPRPPKDDPMTPEELKQYNGTDDTKPVYVAVKGVIFDVSPRREMYGHGKGYAIFAGKDASRALGMSSLNPEDAVSDYSTLKPDQM